MPFALALDWCSVRHRIDGLEMMQTVPCLSVSVRHRIDGLEIETVTLDTPIVVRHRIDGLEIF